MLNYVQNILNSDATRSLLCLVLTVVVILICKISAAWLKASKDGAAAAQDAATATAAKEAAELRDRLIARGLKLVEQVVIYINQTFVEAKRKGDSFNKAAGQLAYERAKSYIMYLINDEIRAAIAEEYKDFDEWLKLSIEAAVNTHKADYLTNKPAEINLTTPDNIDADAIAASAAVAAVALINAETATTNSEGGGSNEKDN